MTEQRVINWLPLRLLETQKEERTMKATKKMDIKEYCNTLYDDLSGMKAKLDQHVAEIETFQGEDKEHVGSHAKHLKELIKTIDWKLEIIAKSCPLDTKRFAKGASETASVPLEDPAERAKRAGGGSIGG